MKISIIGSGYIGLVTGVCLAELGSQVVCIDKDKSKIRSLQQADVPIYEPGLKELVVKNTEHGRLYFAHDPVDHVAQSQFIFICVGTLGLESQIYTDLKFVNEVITEYSPYLQSQSVVVVKSTVPVGTCREIKHKIQSINPDVEFDVASNPEFLKQGTAVSDFMQPDRIVIGVDSDHAREQLIDLYQPFSTAGVPIVVTDLESAELIKYASNTFLATKISFINEIATLCEVVGADIRMVSEGVGLDHRIGRYFLKPGPGYGGSCLPKDVHAIISAAHQYGISSHIAEAATQVNLEQRARVVRKISAVFADDLSDKKLAVLGVAFKAGTNDTRNSPAIAILSALIEKKAQLSVYDPQVLANSKKLLPYGIDYQDTPYNVAQQADAVIILTDWEIFKTLDMKKIKSSMKDNKLIDLHNIYEPDDMKALGFDYYCMGRV